MLAALLVGIATPTISETLQRADARSVARNIANTFRRARNQAMSRGEVVMAEVVTSTDSGDVVLYRTNNRVSTCRSATANRSNLAEVSRTSVQELSGHMEIEGYSPDHRWLCFSPDGRVLDANTQIIRATMQNCSGMNYRLFLAHRDETIDSELKKCRSQSSVQAGQTNQKRLDRQSDHFWIVHVPYNGAVSAHQ